MKYFISTLVIVAITGSAASAQTAQSNKDAALREASLPQTIWFSAEGSHYFITTSCPASSSIAWYSQHWGGKLLKTSVTNAAGELRLKEDTSFHPAFALNNSNGKVGFLEAAEFTLESVKAGTGGGIVTISWKASVAPGQPIVFEVLKAAPGAAYSVAGSYKAEAANTEETFSFTERPSVAGTQYRIRVRNETAGERYLTRSLLQRSGNGAIAVYPTVVKDALTINAGDGTSVRYTITATDGKMIAQGNLENGTQTLSLGTLASGNYLVSVTGEGSVSTTKIIKE